MSGWTVAWMFWIGFFFVIEGPAIANKQPGDTLSEHVWKWFAIRDKSPQWRVRRLALLSGIAWLATHFLSGGWV
jgi:hypothetical protein